ncbi:hypothetical protein [Streptodolium elevatio]|uniref:Uncharacterized protein n=1 Tax=Streptodolium elevatio TaxID=3157996 RepID=A0ABV3DKS0_9ACTN
MSRPSVDPSGSPRDLPLWHRVVWTLVPVVTIGFGAWLPFAYWAYRQPRGSADHRWWLGFAVASAVELVLVFTRPDDGLVSQLVGAYVLLLILAATVATWLKSAPGRA